VSSDFFPSKSGLTFGLEVIRVTQRDLDTVNKSLRNSVKIKFNTRIKGGDGTRYIVVFPLVGACGEAPAK